MALEEQQLTGTRRAILNGPPDSQGLQAEQLRLLYDQFAPAIVVHPLVTGVIAWLYWDHGTVSHTTIAVWLGLSLALLIGRVTTGIIFLRKPPTTPQRVSFYRRWSVFGALAAGGLLGYATIAFNPVLFPLDSNLIYDQAIMIALIGGLAIVGVANYAVYLPSFFAFALPIMLPGGVYLALSGEPTGRMLFYVDLLFVMFLVYSGVRINRMTLQSLTLQQRNQALISYLDRARGDAEALNSKLAREVSERRKAEQRLKDAHNELETLVDDRTRALQKAFDELAQGRERLALAMEASDIGLWDWDLKTDEVFHSNFDRMFGYSQDELRTFRGHLQPLVHPEDFPRIRAAMIAHLKGRTPSYHMIYRTRHQNGNWRWVEDEGKVVTRDAQGHGLRMIGTRRDVTTQHEAAEQQRLAARVFDTATEAIVILDDHFRTLKVNAVFERITGFRHEEVIGKTHRDIGYPEDILNTYRDVGLGLKQDGVWQGEIIEQRRNGERYPARLQMSAVRDDYGHVTHYVAIFSDLTVHREAEEKVRYLANYDKLTGLANRTLFRDRLHSAISEARNRKGNVALLYLDLDRFKQVNDSLGHEVGDKLLYAAATRLMGLDIPADTLSRLGGDEFSIVIEDFGDRRDLEAIATRIIEAIRAPFHIDDHELLLGTSIGIAVFPEDARELQVLINHADTALRQAKRLGGNAFQFHTATLRTASIDQLTLETSLRKAIFRNEFIVYYQPKYDFRTDRLYGVEALVRWQHPTRGILFPKDFLPLAEETGLIGAISELVLERAARQVHSWRELGLPGIKVSVNLSAQQVRKGNLVEVVERVIFSSGLPPDQLELEITESQLMEDIDASARLLQTLHKRGISISLDDFGTGYSSLSYLKRFPIDTVKIDQSFVRDIHKSEDDAAIVRAIIAMAHSLNVKVVAEGVETTAHLDFLKSAGCDGVQGYLISRPVPEAELLSLLRAQTNVA